MNSLMLAAQTIKDSVSALDVAAAMGWEVRHERCRCPIHNGQDMNCRLYPADRGYKCFSCGSAGDVIALVRNSNSGMSFREAVAWFNSTFNLGMDIDSPMKPDALREAKKRQETRARERELQEWKDRMLFEMHLVAGDILRMLERQRDENVPKTPNEEWNWRFRVAVEQIPIWKRIADDAEMNCMKVRR